MHAYVHIICMHDILYVCTLCAVFAMYKNAEGGGVHSMTCHAWLHSRMTIDTADRPSHPYNECRDGARRVFTDQGDTSLLAPSAKRRDEVFGESHEG